MIGFLPKNSGRKQRITAAEQREISGKKTATSGDISDKNATYCGR